jgi:hypothetical protein
VGANQPNWGPEVTGFWIRAADNYFGVTTFLRSRNQSKKSAKNPPAGTPIPVPASPGLVMSALFSTSRFTAGARVVAGATTSGAAHCSRSQSNFGRH